VSLHFDLAGVCRYASDAEPQFHLLRVQAEERQVNVRNSETPKGRSTPEPDHVLDALDRSFGLAPPTESIALEDWEPHNPQTGRFIWGNECDLRGLMLWNARMDWRAWIGPDEGGQWWLAVRESAVIWPKITLDERGLRVMFRSPDGEAGPAFDVF